MKALRQTGAVGGIALAIVAQFILPAMVDVLLSITIAGLAGWFGYKQGQA